jgi:DMSO/TMAO reductase YedYZ molybdopterin-dependent catalytic subunit
VIVTGWYGVAKVKGLAEIHLREDRYLGNFQARWYRNLPGVGGIGGPNPSTASEPGAYILTFVLGIYGGFYGRQNRISQNVESEDVFLASDENRRKMFRNAL